MEESSLPGNLYILHPPNISWNSLSFDHNLVKFIHVEGGQVFLDGRSLEYAFDPIKMALEPPLDFERTGAAICNEGENGKNPKWNQDSEL